MLTAANFLNHGECIKYLILGGISNIDQKTTYGDFYIMPDGVDYD